MIAMKKDNLFSRLTKNSSNIEWVFFAFLTLVLVGLYFWTLRVSPALDMTWKVALFTLLMTAHIAMYWASPWVYRHPQWLAQYFIIHGLIAFAIGTFVRVNTVVFGLYPGLVGLAIGMPARYRWRVLAILYAILLSLANFLLLEGPQEAFAWVLVTVPVVLFVVLYVSLYLRQVEAREKAQSLLGELESANRQLTEYATRVEDLTIVAERQRMARELHDTLSQGLAGLILQLEAVDAHLAGDRPERARTIVREAMERARSTLADARRAIDDLRSSGTLRLGEAARREAEHFTAATGIPCDVEISGPAALPDQVTEAAIRAIAEGLTNIAQHARAKNAILRIINMPEENELEVEINDDGVGFNPGDVETGHYGLLGMSERVRLAGGGLELHSEPGKGTRLVIRFLLEKQADD